MEIQGKIIHVLPLQSGVGKASGKEWKKQDYVLETLDGQYPKKICFNLWGDNIDRIGLQVGEDVTVQIDIESREFNGRWYTEVRAWRVDRGLVSLSAPQQQVAPAPTPASYAAPQPQGFDPLGSAPTMPASGLGAAPAAADDLPF
ncbi:MAG: DUF3127 domain-containing protein [Porphyromonadaceae bacterium]|nr:DUF3127 domain-containing protein [Porphyromonadaceae bacterium]